MKENVKEKTGYTVLFVCTAIVLLLFASSSTSPVYHIFYGDYYNNQTSMGFLIGKGLLQGYTPYVDLFGTSGPLYYLIQAVGWFGAERTGIFILQIVHFTAFLLLIFSIMKKFTGKRMAVSSTLFTIIPYLAMASGGNSDSEWCITLIASAIYIILEELDRDQMRMRSCFLLGVLSGAMFMICFRASGAALGILLFLWGYLLFQKRGGRFWPKMLCSFAGIAVVAVPFVLFFAARRGVSDFIQGYIIYNTRELLVGSESMNLILRKAVKCIAVWFLLAVGILYILKSDRRRGILFICMSCPALIVLMLGQGYWYYYILVLAFWPLAIAAVISVMKGIFRTAAAVGMFCCLAGVCVIPAKAFVTYVLTTDVTNIQILAEDLELNMEKNQITQVFVVGKPASIYLQLDKMPGYKYFANQLEMIEVDESIYDGIQRYLQNEYQDGILLYGTNGWLSEWIGPYQLVDYYYYDHTVVGVYLYNLENMPEEEEHDHEG